MLYMNPYEFREATNVANLALKRGGQGLGKLEPGKQETGMI